MTPTAGSANPPSTLVAPATSAATGAMHDLIAAKRSVLVPMTAIYLVGYIGLTVLAGFAKGLMAQKVVGPVNVGFALIGANYLLAWILAIVYVRVANARFDPLAARAVAAGTAMEAPR